MNSELSKQALAKVGNANVLVNVVSRRVRQLTSSGPNSRPLITETVGMGAADIALTEIIEGKIGWERIEEEANEEAAASGKEKRRKRA